MKIVAGRKHALVKTKPISLWKKIIYKLKVSGQGFPNERAETYLGHL